MTLRNAIGQKLEVGTPVVVVSQGQGWTALSIGRVEKFSRGGLPQVRYLGSAGKRYSPTSSGSGQQGQLSPPLQRYERVFVITEEQYDDLADTKTIVEEAGSEFDSTNPKPNLNDYRTNTTGNSWGWEWNYPDARKDYDEATNRHIRLRKDYINAAMNAAGKENYYD